MRSPGLMRLMRMVPHAMESPQRPHRPKSIICCSVDRFTGKSTTGAKSFRAIFGAYHSMHWSTIKRRGSKRVRWKRSALENLRRFFRNPLCKVRVFLEQTVVRRLWYINRPSTVGHLFTQRTQNSGRLINTWKIFSAILEEL